MKLYQRILIPPTVAAFLLLLLGGAGGFLMTSLLDELGLAWTLVAVKERELMDIRPGPGKFQGRLEASGTPRSPSGKPCAVWEATASWRYGRRDSESCTLRGAAPRLLLDNDSLAVPILIDEDIAPRPTGPQDRLHPWRTLSLMAVKSQSGESIPPAMREQCSLTTRARRPYSTYYSEVCLAPGTELYVSGCRSERGLSACDREMLLSERSWRQLAEDRLMDMRAGLRLLFGIFNLFGLLLLGGLFHKLYPVPEPSSGIADRKVPRVDGRA